MKYTVYILSQGEAGEGARVVGVYSSLPPALQASRDHGSLYPLGDWDHEEADDVHKYPETWVRWDTEGWEYDRVEKWEIQ